MDSQKFVCYWCVYTHFDELNSVQIFWKVFPVSLLAAANALTFLVASYLVDSASSHMQNKMKI